MTNEFDNIPKIFTKETYLVSGSYVQNRVFTPLIAENSTLTDYAGLPQLTGYLATTEKSLANVALVSDKDEPVLHGGSTARGACSRGRATPAARGRRIISHGTTARGSSPEW